MIVIHEIHKKAPDLFDSQLYKNCASSSSRHMIKGIKQSLFFLSSKFERERCSLKPGEIARGTFSE